MNFIDVGNESTVIASKIESVLGSAGSDPYVQALVNEARVKQMLIDAAHGMTVRTVLVLDSGHIVISPVQTLTILQQLRGPVYPIDPDDA